MMRPSRSPPGRMRAAPGRPVVQPAESHHHEPVPSGPISSSMTEARRSGPFGCEREAIDAARRIYDLPPGAGAWAAAAHRLLEDACGEAGVALGAFDQVILLWLASFEPSSVAVIAGWVARAGRAGDEGRGSRAVAR
jgi:hypothetical protein